MWCITFIDLRMLNHPCISGINPTWLWCVILLMCCWIQFAHIFLRIFASMFTRNTGLLFSFLVVSWSGFGMRVNEFGSVPSYFTFCKNLRRIAINFSFNAWWNSPVNSSGPGLFFVERFLITGSISLLVIGLFRFSVFSWFRLGRFMFPGIYPFLLGCLIFWHIIIHSCFLWSLIFLCCNVSSFISAFIYLSLLSFFSLARGLYFCLSFQKQLLFFIDSLPCLSSLYFISFHSGLCYFLPVSFGLVCS